jgi:protein O-GlcNAc transferase
MVMTDATSRAWQLCAQGALNEARPLLVEQLTRSPEDIEAWIILAKLEYQQRDQARALAAAENAALLDPHHPEAQYILGRIRRARAAPAAAEACYRRALAVTPDNPDILTSLGVLLRERGRTEEAIAVYERVLEIDPNQLPAANNLRNAVSSLNTCRAAEGFLAAGRHGDARAALVDGLRIAPRDPALRLAIGKLDCARGRAQFGLEYVEEAARLDPDSWEANEIARRICAAAGLHERALRYGGRVMALAPTEEVSVANRLLLRCIQQSPQTIRETRERYGQGLADSLVSDAPLGMPSDVIGRHTFAVASHSAFYLAYHGENNRALQMQLARLYLERMPGLAITAAHCELQERRPGRLRVGFISRFLRKHSIGMTTRGLIDRLSRERFEVYALRITPSGEDAVTKAIRASADHAVDLSPAFALARDQIAALELDVLFFQDIGMESTSYFLAFSRLAPVQCVSFGHPDTTGIPTMDYFVSNDLFETENAQAHYSERLFLLKDLPTLAYYYKPPLPKVPPPREKFGFREGETLYVCPQTLFKLHPDFDALLDGILVRDPSGIVILIDGAFKEVSEQLRARFRRTLAAANRVRFVPRMPYGDFLQLLAISDVILDTVHFNGMNTSLEAFALGTPVVTLPTQLQRGRHTQAMYRKMQILDCIAMDSRQYVDIAVRLGTEPAYARELRGRILAANHVLFEDRRVVEEFERFFVTALDERLPRGCVQGATLRDDALGSS